MSKALVVMGASLGGIAAFGEVLSRLDPDLPAAIAVCLHRPSDGDSRLAGVLSRRSALPVAEPDDRDFVASGRVYLSPSSYHMMVDGSSISLSTDAPENFARPSIDVLFESAADSNYRPLIGILLTAASEDGAQGLLRISQAGGTTIVQDPQEAESAVAVKAALSRKCVDHVLRLEQMAELLHRLLRFSRPWCP